MNNFYFSLFPHDKQPPYNTNGKILKDIIDPEVVYKLNDVSTLDFKYALTPETMAWLKARSIIAYRGKPFRIKKWEESHFPDKPPEVSVSCYDFLDDLSGYLVNDFFMIGKTPKEMLKKALIGTPFTVAEDVDWWPVKTDLELGTTTPAEVINKIIENTGGGEIYLKDYSIAIVKAVGKKVQAPIRAGTTLAGVQRSVDVSELITVMRPTGQDGLHIGSVTADGVQTIRSRWADVFGEITREVKFGDIEALGEDDPASPNGASALYYTALASMDAPIECGGENLKPGKNKYVDTNGINAKVDLPRVEYVISVIDIPFKDGEVEWNIGDEVTVIDEYMKINTGTPGENDFLNLKQQVIERTVCPTDPRKNTVKLGQHKATTLRAWIESAENTEYVNSLKDKDNYIAEDEVEGTLKTESIIINANGGAIITDRYGVRSIGHVYYDDPQNPQYAVCIGQSVIAMGQKVKGAWVWYNTLDTAITLRDEKQKIRLKMGLNQSDGKFKFALANSDGNATVWIDDDGNAIFSGKVTGGKITSDTTIDVTTDAKIGRALYLSGTSSNGSGIYFTGATVAAEDCPSITCSYTGNTIKISHGLMIDCGTDGAGGVSVATKDDLNALVVRIEALENK